jgi:hypothetical protein
MSETETEDQILAEVDRLIGWPPAPPIQNPKSPALSQVEGKIQNGPSPGPAPDIVPSRVPTKRQPVTYEAWLQLSHNVRNRTPYFNPGSADHSAATSLISYPARAPDKKIPPPPSLPRIAAHDLANFFDRVVVINLKRRADRLAEFNAGITKSGWPFRAPVVFEAVDGKALHIGDVQACMQSHRAVMKQAIDEGVHSLLIFEDDAILCPHFADEAERFLRAVPADWDGIWLGWQESWWLSGHTSPVNQLVSRIIPHRNHAYALRGDAIRQVHDRLIEADTHAAEALQRGDGARYDVEIHCDKAAGELLRTLKIYGPADRLAGQRGSHSELMNKKVDESWYGPVAGVDRIPKLANMDRSARVVIAPYFGEFGWMVMNYIRYVEAHPAKEKIVCCQKGMECLFPSATGFFTDWANPIPDKERAGDDRYGDSAEWKLEDRRVRTICQQQYPGFSFVRPHYDAHWNSAAVRALPSVRRKLPAVDVAIAVRVRDCDPCRNYPHWPKVVAALKEHGLTVGLVGTTDLEGIAVNAKAWGHPDGPTAGSVDLLRHCRLYLGSDSGASHLAALCNAPMAVMFTGCSTALDQRWAMQAGNKTLCELLPNEAWDDPGSVIARVKGLMGAGGFFPRYAPFPKAELGRMTMLVSSDDSYWPLSEFTEPNRREYCERHGVTLDVRRQTHYKPWGQRNEFMLDALEKTDWLIFMDTDTLITNMRVAPADVVDPDADMTIGTDFHGINNGVFFLRNSDAGRSFLERVLGARGKAEHDQAAMVRLMGETPQFKVRIVHQRNFNSYLCGEYGRHADSGTWRQGDFVLHLPAMDFEKRMRLMKEYSDRIVH